MSCDYSICWGNRPRDTFPAQHFFPLDREKGILCSGGSDMDEAAFGGLTLILSAFSIALVPILPSTKN
jgi:hypothetical protein